MSEAWVLHEGDCLDPVTGMASLADRSVVHVICDPPYSEHVHANLGREDRSDGAVDREALRFACLTDDVAAAVAAQACRVASRWIVAFCDELAIFSWKRAISGAGGLYVRCGTWVKADPMPQMTGDRPGAGTESIVIGHAPRERGRMRWNGGGKPATYTGSVRDGGVDREHPTQKPGWLMESLIRDFTDPGDLILDPFAGSGTTGVAAIRLGRRFIGWERDPKYAAVARKRLSAAREQGDLFGARAKKAGKEEQAEMFPAARKVRP